MAGQIAVIGAGSWGTTLAWLLGEQGRAVRLLCRRPEHAAAIRELLEAARDLWRTLPEADDDSERRLVTRTTVRLIQIADTVAVTSS